MNVRFRLRVRLRGSVTVMVSGKFRVRFRVSLRLRKRPSVRFMIRGRFMSGLKDRLRIRPINQGEGQN